MSLAHALPSTQSLSTQSAGGPALTGDQLTALQSARARMKKVLSAARYASFNGWSLAVFGGFSLLFSLGQGVGALLGLGLAVCAWNELAGAAGLRRLEPSAIRRLAWNQAAIVAIVLFYAAWQVHAAQTAPSDLSQMLASAGEGAALGQSIDDLARTLTICVYTLVALCTLIFQGCTAIFYRSRRDALESCVRDTPPWVLDLHRRGLLK